MERIQLILKLLRAIHLHHLASVAGYRFDLLLANDRALLALLNGNEEAVWRFADMARCAYAQLEIPDNVTLAGDLAALVATPTVQPTAA